MKQNRNIKNVVIILMFYISLIHTFGCLTQLRTVDCKADSEMFNWGFYLNLEVDGIGEEISYTIEYEQRLQLMQDGFKIAMEENAWIQLYKPKLIYGVVKDGN